MTLSHEGNSVYMHLYIFDFCIFDKFLFNIYATDNIFFESFNIFFNSYTRRNSFPFGSISTEVAPSLKEAFIPSRVKIKKKPAFQPVSKNLEV